MAVGKREQPDFVAGTISPVGNPSDDSISSVDQGQDFTAGTPQAVLVPSEGGGENGTTGL